MLLYLITENVVSYNNVLFIPVKYLTNNFYIIYILYNTKNDIQNIFIEGHPPKYTCEQCKS
jgi:hypothetical protein